jgi:hypothetical protein
MPQKQRADLEDGKEVSGGAEVCASKPDLLAYTKGARLQCVVTATVQQIATLSDGKAFERSGEAASIARKLIPLLSRRHAVYTSLIFSWCRLEESHARRVRAEWNLSDKDIARLGIRSTPSEVKRLFICHYLAKQCDLHGIAGFYTEVMPEGSERWRLHLPYRDALLVPIRDPRKRIFAIRIFRHVHDKEPHLLTSRGLSHGTPAIAYPSSEGGWRHEQARNY